MTPAEAILALLRISMLLGASLAIAGCAPTEPIAPTLLRTDATEYVAIPKSGLNGQYQFSVIVRLNNISSNAYFLSSCVTRGLVYHVEMVEDSSASAYDPGGSCHSNGGAVVHVGDVRVDTLLLTSPPTTGTASDQAIGPLAGKMRIRYAPALWSNPFTVTLGAERKR